MKYYMLSLLVALSLITCSVFSMEIELLPEQAKINYINQPIIDTNAQDNAYDFSYLTFNTEITGHNNDITSMVFSPDGKYLATSSLDGTVRLWNIGAIRSSWIYNMLWSLFNGLTKQVLKGNRCPINTTIFSINGKYLAAGHEDGTIILWDAQTAKLLKVLRGDTHGIRFLAFDNDSNYIAASSPYGVRLWDIATGNSRFFYPTESQVLSLAFSPDGKYLAIGLDDTTIQLWDRYTDCLEHIFKVRASSIQFSRDSNSLITASDTNMISISYIDTGKTHTIIELTEDMSINGSSVTFSPDGNYIMKGSKGTACLWHIRTGQLVQKVTGNEATCTAIAFSPDGNYAVVNFGKRAKLFNFSIPHLT